MRQSGSALRRGAKSSTSLGAKPSVAFASERAAKTNIEDKLSLLKLAIRKIQQGDLSIKEANLPKSLRQFNAWTPRDVSGNSLLRNSRETVLRYPDLQESVKQAVDAIQSLRESSTKRPGKDHVLAAARRNGALNKTMREIAERELMRVRAAYQAIGKELEICEAKLKSIVKKAASDRDDDQREMEALRAENARLVRALGKIVPIRKK